MQTNWTYTMFVPTMTLFGSGQLDNLHKQKLPGKKALIVISNGKSTRANGFLDRTEEQLKKAGVEFAVFDEIEPNPLTTTCDRGGEAARKNGCDFIVALGGGSVMDASKGIATVATNEGKMWDYIQTGTGGRKQFKNKPLPIVAITTTAGTGSETDPGAVISNIETHEKPGFVHPALFPVLAIVDPELTKPVPPKFTAYQGFDALFHSTEGYLSKFANLMGDMYALTAIKSIGRHLARAVRDGSDTEARTMVSWGNTLSGSVMCVSCCTSEHSIEHALSAFHHELPHGAGLIMVSKAYYTHFIKKGVRPERFIEMAKALGKEDAKEPMDFVVALDQLQRDCGVADLKMSEYGIKPEEFMDMAKNARETMGFLFESDPVPITNEDVVAIYTASYK